MAELIDRKAFIEWFKDNYKTEQVDEDTGETTEYDIWISSVDVIDDIESFTPYTTETEIRAKAYERFAEKLKESLLKNYRHFITTDTDGFDWLTTDAVGTHIDKVVDQLKEG